MINIRELTFPVESRLKDGFFDFDDIQQHLIFFRTAFSDTGDVDSRRIDNRAFVFAYATACALLEIYDWSQGSFYYPFKVQDFDFLEFYGFGRNRTDFLTYDTGIAEFPRNTTVPVYPNTAYLELIFRFYCLNDIS